MHERIHALGKSELLNMEAAGLTNNEAKARFVELMIGNELPAVWLNKDYDKIEGHCEATARVITIIDGWSSVRHHLDLKEKK